MGKIAAPIVTTPVYSCRIGGTLATGGAGVRPCGNLLYYRLSTLVSAPTKAALNTAFQAGVIATLKLAANARYSPNNVNIRDITNAADAEQQFTAAGTGAIATAAAESDDAVLFCLQSGFRGKQAKAFKHFGGFSDADVVGDVLTGGALVLWQAVKTALAAQLTDGLGNIWTPWIRSQYQAQYFTPPLVIRGYDVVSAYVSTVIGTMRKRKAPGIKA